MKSISATIKLKVSLTLVRSQGDPPSKKSFIKYAISAIFTKGAEPLTFSKKGDFIVLVECKSACPSKASLVRVSVIVRRNWKLLYLPDLRLKAELVL